MANKIVKTIDCTPTWEGILPAIVAVIETSTNRESISTCKKELKRMAQIADCYVAQQSAAVACLANLVQRDLIKETDNDHYNEVMSIVIPADKVVSKVIALMKETADLNDEDEISIYRTYYFHFPEPSAFADSMAEEYKVDRQAILDLI